jgi:hypothetical protein
VCSGIFKLLITFSEALLETMHIYFLKRYRKVKISSFSFWLALPNGVVTPVRNADWQLHITLVKTGTIT